MNKFYLIMIIVITASLHAAESAENLATQFSVKPRREQKMENLPVGREQEVIEALVRLGDIHVLLRLNHAPTVERVMTEFLSAEGKAPGLIGSIAASGSPYIIHELAPSLYKSDRIQHRTYGESSHDYGESAQAAEIIGQLIIRAPEFPPESREWARKHLGGPGSSVIQAARAWWELNHAALLANQFDKVQVPASYPEGPHPQPSAPESIPPPSTIEPAPATEAISPPPEPTPDPVKPPVATTIPPPTAAPPPAKASNPVWWIVGLTVFASGAVLVARRKKPGA